MGCWFKLWVLLDLVVQKRVGRGWGVGVEGGRFAQRGRPRAFFVVLLCAAGNGAGQSTTTTKQARRLFLWHHAPRAHTNVQKWGGFFVREKGGGFEKCGRCGIKKRFSSGGVVIECGDKREV